MIFVSYLKQQIYKYLSIFDPKKVVLFAYEKWANISCKSSIQKRFYNRKSIAALYQIHHIFHIPIPFNATKMINPFPNSRISANHDKVERLFANDEILIKVIVSLLLPI